MPTFPTIPPDNRAGGSSGHLSDHTNLSDLATAYREGGAAKNYFLNGGNKFREPYPRYLQTANIALATGVMALSAVDLYAGDVISKLAYFSSAAAVTPTHWWFALYDTNLNLLSQTPDQATAAWATTTTMDLSLNAPQTITVSGVYYAGIMMAAATPVGIRTLQSAGGFNAGLVTGQVTLGATNGSALTATAPAGPLTLTASANIPYVVLH